MEVPEMEPGGELREESSLSLDLSVDDQQSPEQVQIETEDSLSESSGNWLAVLPKKAVKVLNDVAWSELSKDGNTPSRKRRREKMDLYEGRRTCSSPQQKKKKSKKNKVPSGSELKNTLIPQNLVYPLIPEMAEANNPPKESLNEKVKLTEPVTESSGDSGGQNERCITLDANQSLGIAARNTSICTDSKDQSEQDNTNGAEAQHPDPESSGEKIEELRCKTESITDEQTTSNKTQSHVHTSTVDQPQRNASETETLSGDAASLDSGESAEKISDLHLNNKSSENEHTKLGAEAQSQGSETEKRQTKEEQESKQPESVSSSKKLKLEEEKAKGETVCKKVEETETPKGKSAQGTVSIVADPKKQQVNQKDKKQQTNYDIGAVKPSQVNSSDGITVYFHAILSRDFKLDPNKQKLFIRAGGISGYMSWKDNVCEMSCERVLEEHGHLFHGYVTISKDNMDKPIPYKYFISYGEKGDYEFIYKSYPKGVIVNRCLFISSKDLIDRDWHQYDDIICAKPQDNMWNNFKKGISFWKTSEKDIVKGKLIAAEIMLDSIFSILSTWTPVAINNFLGQFNQFFLVNKRPMVYETSRVEWTELQHGEDQLKAFLLNYLRKRAHRHDPSQDTALQEKLGEALIFLILGVNFKLPVLMNDLKNLCSLLCLEKPEVNEIKLIKEAFSRLCMEKYLTWFCNDCIDKQVDQWLWTIPVLHLFTASVENKSLQGNALLDSEERWARLEHVPFVHCRSNDIQKKNFLQLMKEKQHLVKGNRALFRSWFSLLSLKDLVEFITTFPADLLDYLLGTFHRLKSVTIGCCNYEQVEKLLEKICTISKNQNGSLQKDIWDSTVTVSLRLHQLVCKKVQTVPSYKLPAMTAEIVSSIIGCAPLELSTEKKIFETFQETTRNWLRNVLPKSMLKSYTYSVELTSQNELTAWACFLKIIFPCENLTKKWKETLISDMESRIKQEAAVQQIRVYCCCFEKFENVDALIRKTFENCAIEAINSACQEQTNLLDMISSYNLNKLGKIVSAVITKSWPSNEAGKPTSDFEVVLNHLLTWPDIKHLFTFNGAGKNFLDQLTDEAKELMTIADSVHTKVSDELMKGCILVKHFIMIAKHRKQFLSISELKWKQLSPMEKTEHKSELERVLELRWQEVMCVKREQNCLGSFLDMCRKVQDYVKVDIAEIEQKHRENLTVKALDDIVKVRHLVSLGDDDIETYYNLNASLKEKAQVMHNLKESHVFQYCWEWAAKELAGDTEDDILELAGETFEDDILEFEDVPSSLFEPCYSEFTRLYSSLKSGEIIFAEVDVLFKDFTNKYKELKNEFQIMSKHHSDDGTWINQRVQQIQQYHELHLAVDSAKVIEKLKKGLNLSGDFRVLILLLNFSYELSSFQQKSLSCMSPELMRTKKLLQGITEPRRVCLEQLVLRWDFINWVKEALEDINELKVFVDLASISAGENDMDVDRVACFHDAVLGYSSLLYDLNQESGFEEFMKCLEKLWKALESDPNLPQKLYDSARYLEWLKTIKESHGSVELSSISLATTINKKGIYRISAPAEDQKVSLGTVLCLTILENRGDEEEERHYSLEELRELMNKLMLMSGKVEQSAEVEKFCEVFSSVERLALTFIDLYSAGNMLFRSWIADVYCSSKNGFCIRMDFKLNSVCDLSGGGELTDLLPVICRMMESFLERWNHFMSEKRSQYFYLNYYTAEQLVYLCRELDSECPSEVALMMLSFIKHNCNKRDVREALRKVLSQKPRKNLVDQFEFMERRRDLTAQLEHIWESYMERRGFFLPGYLDIETLGVCLAALACLEKRCVVRILPQGLHADRPNLILCPRSKVLLSTLAIYMSSPEEPLPSCDEVLLCTPQTNYEQVALFLRRCLTPCRKEKKIYSLLYADELSYDVACRSEELFQKLHSKHQDDYCFVILCNCEREHCYIPSAFSQFKVHMIPQQPLQDIQSYLGRHYRVMQPTSMSASVFKGQACVGIVSSKRAGMGKSLYVKRLQQILERKLQDEVPLHTIRLIDSHIDEGKVLKSLLPFLDYHYQKRAMIFHFDITSSVQTGIPEFLFKLLVLCYLADVDGKFWLRKQHHLYVIEILETSPLQKKQTRILSPELKYDFLDVFPKVNCKSPKKVLEMDTQRNLSQDCSDPGMDEEEFCSEAFQRPTQYLRRFNRNENLDAFQYKKESVEGTPTECLQLLLLYCGVIDPSWSELRNFAWFLNLQLKNCETSVFCNASFVQDTLQGFKNFVVSFMILMAKDFATPSLNISDESPGRQHVNMEGVKEEDLLPFHIRKKWESEPHPYIFFNEDSISMTFIGFHLQPGANGGIDAINPMNGHVIKRNVMTTQLYEGLCLQRVRFNVDFDTLPRHEKIEKLSMVLGLQWPIDPDETYELTTDNILKILAIEMRFRCGIPVVLMGETGCGKTRLIKFLCELRRCGANAENMKLVKVHGGTTADAVYAKVREAEALAIENKREYQFDTILFFDEANTTEAVSSIKEVLCDRTVQGWPLFPNSGLQIIAACNPYRKHTERMIERLESAGLGYRVKAEETKDKLGSIPLRQLVYRVHALPPSMIPLVWDFGQLNNMTEKLYIQQIVQRLIRSIPMSSDDLKIITEVLFVSQTYMRQRNDECGFISLRDVERCVEVLKWFHSHSELLRKHLRKYLAERKIVKGHKKRDTVIWSLVLSVGVCYHASLERKKEYREEISKVLPAPYNDEKGILEEIGLIQDLFLSGAPLRETIARNLALKENVFMMVICIELKIPLFLIGKPGSSKSLAKTIVADAMQGQAAHSELYKELKQIHLVSFQCSPHSTPEGIINTFKHCARFQEGKNLKEYVSVVVLDEIGLAEDSPKMPLKTLHPLLEDGCVDDDPVPHKKVGFIGISNWALDPAKMNRGIFVSRGNPNKKELVESAKGICSSDPIILQKVQHLFPLFANAYDKICESSLQVKEFFGLRDYYSLIKMVFALTKTHQREPPLRDIAEVVLRNFSGKEGIEAVDIFMAEIPEKGDVESISTIDLIRQNINCDSQDAECRYLLVLTENYAALQILHQAFFTGQQPEIIFGSSFPKDQEYTQICRNINRVKICMETGQMVILLNLQNLYESLYDALNQYYVQLAGQKYVDLGLGTHRVKCRVHPKFRLIVIEEKEVVYKHFPIPLINRLEKHCLDINCVLDKHQRLIVEELKKWVKRFTAVDTEQCFRGQQKYTPSDVFVGYHSDTCASVVLQITEKLRGDYSHGELMSKILEEAKLVLLNCATPDSVIRLCSSQLGSFLTDELAKVYFQDQHHTSLADFFQICLCTESKGCPRFTEITTFSRLLTAADAEILEAEVLGNTKSLKVLFLQQFDTEHSFLKEVRNFVDSTPGNKILIIQTDFENGPLSAQLIASAKYSAINEINKIDSSKSSMFVFFITKLSRVEGGNSYVGFQGGLWQSVHIDDLRTSKDMVSDITTLRNVTISQLFSEDLGKPEESLEPMMVEAAEENEEEMEIDYSKTPRSETYTNHILDTTNLLRSCVQSAVGMLRDQNEGANRSMKRIQILLSLLSEEGNLQGRFLKITKNRLLNLLKKQEESSFAMNQWVLREASNPSALQEAGTFRRTLWKRIQNVVIPFLAYIISVLDRDSNLELLVRSTTENCVKELWMFIFNDLKLLDIPYIMGQSSSQTETLLVQNDFEVSEGTCNEMPFSWRIKDYLENLWVQAQHVSGHGGQMEKLIDIFQRTPLGQYISDLPEKERGHLFNCYVRDFILQTMGISSDEQLKLLSMALLSCIEEMKAASPSAQERVLPLPWIHLAYHQFSSRLQNLSRILAVYPDVFDVLTKHVLIQGSILHHQMVLDMLAAKACTEMLEAKLLNCRPRIWLQQVKNLQMPIELACTANYLQSNDSQCNQLLKEVKDQWNRIFVVSLFVEHVLLGAESLFPAMQHLVKKYTQRLGHCFQSGSDIKTHTTFTAVMKTLCHCKEEASSTIFRFGLKPCPICLGDPREPVNLPCDHVYCQICIKHWLVPGQMLCPLCRTSVSDDYSLTVSEEIRISIEKNAQFRKFCNSFFIDLVSTMCFKDNEPPEKAVIQELLKLLFVQKEILKGERGIYTKSLSPFDDVVDKTPVIRSVLLKLLLKYSFENVKAYVQEYLSDVERSQILDQEDKIEVYTLFVNCLEDSAYEKSATASEKVLRENGCFLANYIKWHFRENFEKPSVEYLQGVANIRLCLDSAAELLFEFYGPSDGGKEKDKQLYLQRVREFCCRTQNDWYRVYLVRKLTNQYGLEFTQRLSNEDQCYWIFPVEIIQQQQVHQSDQIDRFLVCGKNYKQIRDAIGKAMLECKTESIGAIVKACNGSKSMQAVHILLAVFRELTSLYRCRESDFHPKQKQCDILKEFIKSSEILPTPELKTFAESLVANNLPSLTVNPQDPSYMKIVMEMAVHTATVLLCGQNKILEPLRNLAFSPSIMQHAFLPTMPEDLLKQAAQVLGNVHWYTCPNGHPCTVGECGRPMERAQCVDCGAPIGGERHIALPNFAVMRTEGDRTQTGHLLGNPGRREAVVASEREMSPAVLILIRLLTHLALFLGATKDHQSVLQIIKPPVQDPVTFLMQHILKDLEQLMNTLGKSMDETTNVVHLILCGLLKDHHQHKAQWPVHFDGQLSTKEKRNNWEGIVARTIIVPELKDLDRTLLELNQQITEDERVSSSPLVKIIYGDPAIFLAKLPKNSTVHCSRMWSCRKRISVEHLGYVVQQKGGKDVVPILWKFLQKEAELRLVKFLPEILSLQKDLVRRFQNKPEVESCNIGEFLNSLDSESIRSLMKNRVNKFLSVWNRLRRSLETNGEIKLPQGYCDADLTLDDKLEILVPRRRGLGLCSTALASYLISLHNYFVYTIEETSKDTERYSVNPTEVTDLHVITYEVERDLIPLILSNCQYSVVKGKEALEEFDLEKIQQQIVSRFLRGKPLITLTGIPTLVYRHDRNYEHLFRDIKSKLSQRSLPNSTISMITGELQSYSDICEALYIIEIILEFLAMDGGDSNMTLAEYVENFLQMSSHTSDHVLKALSRCHLKQAIAVWQLLSCHKSEQLLHRKRDPFTEVNSSYKESLTPENTKHLNSFLMQAGLENFLQELHEMIILKLKHAQPGDFNPTWSLKDTLISYLERKESDTLELEDTFPEDILLSQCISAWKTAAVFKHDRRLG